MVFLGARGSSTLVFVIDDTIIIGIWATLTVARACSQGALVVFVGHCVFVTVWTSMHPTGAGMCWATV